MAGKRLAVLNTLLFLFLGAACGVNSRAFVTATPEPTPTVTPAPQVRGIYTPEDMQWRFDEWPNEYKFALDDGVVVEFAYPDRLTDWIGRVFIEHIPSFSSVALDREGNIVDEHYGSEEGRARIQAVLDDPAWMQAIRAKVERIWRTSGSGPRVGHSTANRRFNAM